MGVGGSDAVAEALPVRETCGVNVWPLALAVRVPPAEAVGGAEAVPGAKPPAVAVGGAGVAVGVPVAAPAEGVPAEEAAGVPLAPAEGAVE